MESFGAGATVAATQPQPQLKREDDGDRDDHEEGNAPPLSGSLLLETLARHGRERHPGSDTVAATAPEEAARVPMLRRGVTLALLRRVVRELQALGRGDVDCGQFLNGVHTTDSATDWREFDRARDGCASKTSRTRRKCVGNRRRRRYCGGAKRLYCTWGRFVSVIGESTVM